LDTPDSTTKTANTERNDDSQAASGGNIDGIIQKVVEGSNRDEAEIRKLIGEKQDELSGLVSKEGAAYIVARELGVNLLKATKRELKVKNLLPGLRSVDLMARIVRIFEAREWSKGDRSGRVASMILGDETGTIRLSLWNDEVDILENEKIEEGDTIKVSGAFVKMDSRGQPDLRIGRGKIEPAEDGKIKLPMPDEIKRTVTSQRREIKDLKEGEFGETRACLVQIFSRSRPFYEVCPQCGGRVMEDGGKYECKEHGQVEPAFRMVVSGVIDDGTANMRIVFFGETGERVLGKTVQELRDALSKGKSQDEIYADLENIGKEFVFQGRVKRNDLSGNLEMVANEAKDVDLKEEANRLIEELKQQND
jgi:ssDNA-binding replication factor A large subunit